MNLRTRFERFCFKHRDKGIPNLMLYIVIGNGIVGLLSLINGGSILYELLCFDKGKILQGEVWRLITYVFTQRGSTVLGLLLLYFFYILGRQVELSMGTLKFNLYYLTGVVLMDIFAMCFCPVFPVTYTTTAEYEYYLIVASLYSSMSTYLHLTLILTFATMHPDAQFRILFIIPIKGWVLGLIDLLLQIVYVINLSVPVFYFPHNLFPLAALGSYFLFMGKDVMNLIPFRKRSRTKPSQPKTPSNGTIPFRPNVTHSKKPDFNHRCTICGRTDLSNPELEFRYCSRCTGYHCYCEDHINNHTHIQE